MTMIPNMEQAEATQESDPAESYLFMKEENSAGDDRSSSQHASRQHVSDADLTSSDIMASSSLGDDILSAQTNLRLVQCDNTAASQPGSDPPQAQERTSLHGLVAPEKHTRQVDASASDTAPCEAVKLEAAPQHSEASSQRAIHNNRSVYKNQDTPMETLPTIPNSRTTTERKPCEFSAAQVLLLGLPVDALHSIASFLTPTEWSCFSQCSKGAARACREVFRRVRMHGFRCATEVVTAMVCIQCDLLSIRPFLFCSLIMCSTIVQFETYRKLTNLQMPRSYAPCTLALGFLYIRIH